MGNKTMLVTTPSLLIQTFEQHTWTSVLVQHTSSILRSQKYEISGDCLCGYRSKRLISRQELEPQTFQKNILLTITISCTHHHAPALLQVLMDKQDQSKEPDTHNLLYDWKLFLLKMTIQLNVRSRSISKLILTLLNSISKILLA